MAAARIAGSIDDNVLASLQGNIHPLALADYDEGRVDDNLPLEHVFMMLRRSSVQETALAARIDQMHNQRSPYYHQWLSGEDVGRCYGVADSDIAVVMDWLQRHGFKIDTVPAGKTTVIFRRCLLLGYMSLPNFVQNLKPVPLLCRHPQPRSRFRHALSKVELSKFWKEELLTLR
jgi:biotin operon repressor